ncbi:hypothetical protein DFJ73DRAFT_962914 [Zopfochytrium polystomum]|nr:hypothetical protein DFJ73DRAFT_962914 [Zopfochytrium polystomum]
MTATTATATATRAMVPKPPTPRASSCSSRAAVCRGPQRQRRPASSATARALVPLAAIAALAPHPASSNPLWIPGNPLGDTSITFNFGYLKDADQPGVHDNIAWQKDHQTITYQDCMNYVRGKVPAGEVDLIVWNQDVSPGGIPGCFVKKYDRMAGASIVWGGDMNWVLPGRYFIDNSYGPWYSSVTLNDCANTCLNDGTRCAAAMYFSNGSCIMKGFNYPHTYPNQYVMFPWWQWVNGAFDGTIAPTAPAQPSVAVSTTTVVQTSVATATTDAPAASTIVTVTTDSAGSTVGTTIAIRPSASTSASAATGGSTAGAGSGSGGSGGSGGGSGGGASSGQSGAATDGGGGTRSVVPVGAIVGGVVAAVVAVALVIIGLVVVRRRQRDTTDTKTVGAGYAYSGPGGGAGGEDAALYAPGHGGEAGGAGGAFGIASHGGPVGQPTQALTVSSYQYPQPIQPGVTLTPSAQAGYDGSFNHAPSTIYSQSAGGYSESSFSHNVPPMAAPQPEAGMWVAGATAGASAQSVPLSAPEQSGNGSEKSSLAWKYNEQPAADRKVWPVPVRDASRLDRSETVAMSSTGELFPPAYSETTVKQ